MSDLYFTKDHEWILVEGDIATVGITDHAQRRLGDVVFVDIPQAGRAVSRGKEAAVVESVKAASDVYAPIDGVVAEGNAALDAEPSLVNAAAQGEGWFFKMTVADKSQLEGLMDRAAYDAFLAG